MKTKSWTRRQVLKGAGVALSLPWLETMAPRTARAQAAAAKKRYVMLYFPNGAADFWLPPAGGTGDAWKLSPILEPLAPVKKYVTIVGQVGYQPALQNCNPSHSQLGAGISTCTVPDAATARNGISVDQVIAQHLNANMATKTVFPSLQVGLATMLSYPDGQHPAHSRSISWASATQPLYKVINPQAVFDSMLAPAMQAAGMTSSMPDPVAERRRLLKKSSLDYIVEQSTTLKTRLSKSDGTRLDQFLTSVRNIENRLTATNVTTTAGCKVGTRPPMAYTTDTFTGSGAGKIMAGYDRNAHADVMTDLMVMALQCDLTRVMTHMIDDARSDFPYLFLKLRNFTDGGSVEATSSVTNGNISDGLSGFHGLQHAGDRNDGFATINYWLSLKASQFAQKLMASNEGATNILDNTTIHFGSGMHGGNHKGINVPLALIGGHGGALKKDTYIPFTGAPQLMQNLHVTIMQKVFGMPATTTFASNTGIMPELVA